MILIIVLPMSGKSAHNTRVTITITVTQMMDKNSTGGGTASSSWTEVFIGFNSPLYGFKRSKEAGASGFRPCFASPNGMGGERRIGNTQKPYTESNHLYKMKVSRQKNVTSLCSAKLLGEKQAT